jgi:endoribonuclease Dicer
LSIQIKLFSFLNCFKIEKKTFLSLENAIEIINRYCIRLPSDALTQLTPHYELIQLMDNTNGRCYFNCKLYLPINSGVRDCINSNDSNNSSQCYSASQAKAVAAFKACLLLYQRNELNDMLEPITKEMFYKIHQKFDCDDEKEWRQFAADSAKNKKTKFIIDLTEQQHNNYMSHRPGGSKRKQVYRRKESPYLKSLQVVNTSCQCFLYILECRLKTPLNPLDSNLKTNDKWTFGLLTSRTLLETVDFPIFTHSGEEMVKCNLLRSGISLSPNQFKLIKNFHKFIFSNVLRYHSFCFSFKI